MLSTQTICNDIQMRPLQYRYLWLFGGMCLVILVLYTTLMPASSSPSMLLNDKAAHGIAFFAMMIWFCGVFEMRVAPLVAVALVCLGILIELIQQQLTYRSAELADGLADIGGIAVGWALAAAGFQHWATFMESWVTSDRS